jgi:HEAT repeat protein
MLWWTLQKLKSTKPEVRAGAARDLGNAKLRRAVPSLIKSLADAHPQVRLAVIGALGQIRHPASAEPLARALEAKPGFRDEAEYELLAKALAALGPTAVSPLLPLLGSDDKGARRWAARALGGIRDPQAVDPLENLLEDIRSEVRRTAALALGEIGDPRALKSLIKALANRDLETRRAAAEALGALGSQSATDALAASVGDQSELVQLSAIGALGKIGGLPAAACLRSAATGPRKAVCDAARAALKSMRFSPSNAEERAEMAVISGDFAAALREGAPAVGALIRALEVREPQIRAKAAEGLGALRSLQAVGPLLQALRDHNPVVQQAAMNALAEIGAAAREGLEAFLAFYDASVARLAASALGRIADARSVPALVQMIAANRNVSQDYPEMFDALTTAVDSLAGLLTLASAEISPGDLERIAELPEKIHLVGAQPARSVDCTPLRDKAREELLRRSEIPRP